MEAPIDQHIDTDESDLEAYRANLERMKGKLGNGGSRRLATEPEPTPAISPFKAVQNTSPATAYKVKAGHCAATGHRVWEFYRSGLLLAVIDTSTTDTAELEAELLAFYPVLKFMNRNDIVEVYPRVQVEFVVETFPKPRNKVTALEVLPLDDADRGAYYTQELKVLALELKLSNADFLPIIRQNVIDKGRRVTQADFEAARTALNALATKKGENELSKKSTQPEYVSPSVANADTPMFAQQPASELDTAFPRDGNNQPIEEKPEVDELTGKADKPEQAPAVKHWANEGWWNAKLNKEVKAIVKQTAIMSDAEWRDLAHTLLGRALRMEVKSFKDVDPSKLDGESALKAITAELKLEFVQRRTDPATKDIPYWENPEAIARIKHELESTGLPEKLGIAPSEVMTAAYKIAGVKDMAEWAQGGGNTGKMFYQHVVKKWDAEVKALEVPFDDEPEQPAQAPSTSIEPPTTPDTTQSTHSAPAVNGNGQSSKPVEMKPVPTQSQALVVPNTGLATLPMVAQWEIMRQQADVLIKSGFLPKSVDTAEKAIAIMMMGSALAIEPIVALQMINVIAGKPTVSPQLQMALVYRSGQLEDLTITDDGTTCTVVMKRRGKEPHTERFSMDDAQRLTTTEWENGSKRVIPLAKKKNWIEQPAVMRKWRAISAANRVVFPDVCWGIAAYTTEEIDPDVVIDAEAA